MLPAKTAGLIEFRLGRRNIFYPYGGPMNGQAARLEMARSIIEKCEIEQIIETGTYRGTTTEWFSQFSIPVFSAEIQPRFASFAQRRMADRPNVHIENLDSVVALKRWSEAPDIVSRRTLFYLDAHSKKKYLPLSKELEVISQKFSSWVAVIDDFKVPFDEHYEFEDFGPGQVLDMEYLKRCDIRDAVAFFPSVGGRWETGLKRGCVVLVGNRELAAKCRAVPLLQLAAAELA